MERPKKCIYPNCYKCVYQDCRYDGLDYKDIIAQDRFDKELEIIEPEIRARRIRQSRYSKSDKGKARQIKYNNSDKGKASRKRYSATEKGKQNAKRKSQRKIDNGRNAEYCRRYYYKKKMEMQGA